MRTNGNPARYACSIYFSILSSASSDINLRRSTSIPGDLELPEEVERLAAYFFSSTTCPLDFFCKSESLARTRKVPICTSASDSPEAVQTPSAFNVPTLTSSPHLKLR